VCAKIRFHSGMIKKHGERDRNIPSQKIWSPGPYGQIYFLEEQNRPFDGINVKMNTYHQANLVC
jgi:hypothetical protein